MKRLLGMVLLVVASAGLLTGVTVMERGMAYFSSEVVLYPFGEGVLATMPNGRIYHLWIFDKDLEELRNFDLRRGEGPGDVKIIKGIVADGERIYVWDDGLRRLSIFTRDWKFVEFKPVPSLPRALLLEKVDHGFVFKWGDLWTCRDGHGLTRTLWG